MQTNKIKLMVRVLKKLPSFHKSQKFYKYVFLLLTHFSMFGADRRDKARYFAHFYTLKLKKEKFDKKFQFLERMQYIPILCS